MTYWLLTTEYPPFFGGGISTYCHFTAKMLVENGHQVTVFINDASIENFSESHNSHARIIRFNPNRTGAASFLGHVTNTNYAFAQIVEQYIKQEGKPGLIEAQDYLGIAYYLLQYKHLGFGWCHDVPVLITTHSPAFLYLRYNHVPTYRYPEYWVGEMERFCLQAATTVISPSRYLIDAIKKEFPFTNTRAFIVPYPFEVHARSGAPEPTANSEKIIFYGKLSAQKGTFKLLDYFEKLWDEDFNESLYVYGGDDIVYHPEGKAMGAIVRERYGRWIQAGKLHLNPKIAPSEMETHLGGAKLIIVPSTVDNLPFVVLEMMALGNIVLASKQGGQSEIITDGEDGFLFDHEQSQTFKAKLFQIIMLTPEERKTIRQKARQRIATAYNPDLIYAQKIGVLEKAAMQKQSGQFPFTRQLQAPATSEEELLFQKGLLSVVVPYYNLGRYIGETIASLQQCLYREMEIIIVNDGSTDNASLQALEAYRNNKGITIIDTPNGGLANARNTGAWAARGEYLAFLDADDMVTPDYYIKAIAVLKRWSNVYFVGCWTQYFAGSSNVWPTFTPEPPIILYHNTINSSALVYKRTSFLHKGLNDAHMTFPGLEDYESVIALLNAGYRGVILPELLFKYRVRTNSMIRSISKNKKLYLVQYITEKHKRFYATFAAEIASLLQANGPGIYLDNPTLDYTVYSKHRLLNKIAAKTIGFVKRSPRLKKMALTVYRKLKS